ncbi:DUF202 domain-containing protein [Pseudomonas yangonensis]|uniref:DUF202 domain-containing protein n=1 Tax=Pseudomonas yangonensis TaxID=2579922 RepID=UPI00137B048F|nr:DUF202 domain-containing protein [Pseudomonas yangonensis]
MAVVDPGLQAERTELAWRRTQLSLLVIACLMLRGVHPAPMMVALAMALTLWSGQRQRYLQSLAMLLDERGTARCAIILSTALVLTGLNLLMIWTVLAGE